MKRVLNVSSNHVITAHRQSLRARLA